MSLRVSLARTLAAPPQLRKWSCAHRRLALTCRAGAREPPAATGRTPVRVANTLLAGLAAIQATLLPAGPALAEEAAPAEQTASAVADIVPAVQVQPVGMAGPAPALSEAVAGPDSTATAAPALSEAVVVADSLAVAAPEGLAVEVLAAADEQPVVRPAPEEQPIPAPQPVNLVALATPAPPAVTAAEPDLDAAERMAAVTDIRTEAAASDAELAAAEQLAAATDISTAPAPIAVAAAAGGAPGAVEAVAAVAVSITAPAPPAASISTIAATADAIDAIQQDIAQIEALEAELEEQVATLVADEPPEVAAALEAELQAIEAETAVLEAEEEAVPGAPGLLPEAEAILLQLAAFKALLKDVSAGIFAGLKLAV